VSGNGVRNVSFALRRGEVLGFSGMTGSGRSELMEVLFGAARLDAGEILLNGRRVHHATPKSSIRNRMCFITEDRQNTGLFLEQPIAQNVTVANMVNTRSLLASPAEDIRIAEGLIKKLLIRAGDAKVRVVTLSGGNQQKVVLAKWFNTSGEVFIFDEPTRGIDVNSKQEIYQLMVGLLKQGKAIMMVSSDMPEVISMSDRVVVMKDGEMVGEIGKDRLSEENILTYSIGDKAV
jgi:ribose transport system ATP-binding protein